MILSNGRPASRTYIAVLLLVLWVSFALHIAWLADTRHAYDRSYPHGVALALRDTAGTADFRQHGLHSQRSGLRIINPVGYNYMLAGLSLLDRGAIFATFITAMSNVLVTALSASIARRLMGPVAGLVAAVLAATNTWSIYFSRGTWLLGPFELAVVVGLWWIVTGWKSNSARPLLLSSLAAAGALQIYSVGLGVAAQWFAGSVWWLSHPSRHLRAMGRAVPFILTSLSIILASALFYVYVIQTDQPNFLSAPVINLAYGESAQVKAADGLAGAHLARPMLRALDFTSARTFAYATALGGDSDLDPATLPGWIKLIQTLRGYLIEILMVVGAVYALANVRRRPALLLPLLWLAVPVVGMMVVSLVSPATPITTYYLILTSPAGTVLAAMAAGRLARDVPRRGVAGVVVCALMVLAVPPWTHFQLAAERHTLQPIDQKDYEGALPISLPLRAQAQLRGFLWEQCDAINVDHNPFEAQRLDLQYWAASLMGDFKFIRPNASVLIGSSDTWLMSPHARVCMVRLSPLLPSLTEVLDSPLANTPQLKIYRSQKIDVSALIKESRFPTPMLTNLGWSLISLHMPLSVSRGETISVTHVWRIERLPAEAYATWRYDPFLTLRQKDTQTVLLRADASSLPGSAWRIGDYIVSTIRTRIPQDAAPGEYVVSSALYDRTQQKNAVYFSETGTASVDVQFAVTIQ